MVYDLLMVNFGWEPSEMLDTHKTSMGVVVCLTEGCLSHPKFKGSSGLPSFSNTSVTVSLPVKTFSAVGTNFLSGIRICYEERILWAFIPPVLCLSIFEANSFCFYGCYKFLNHGYNLE